MVQSIDPTLRDTVIAGAQNFNDFVSKAQTYDRPMYDVITGRYMTLSHTPLGAAAGGVVGYVGAHYGLGLSPDVVQLISGVFAAAAGYLLQWWQARNALPTAPPKA